MAKVRKSKNQLRREKQKLRKLDNTSNNVEEEQKNEDGTNIEPLKEEQNNNQADAIEIDKSDPLLQEYELIFDKFTAKDTSEIVKSKENTLNSNKEDSGSNSDADSDTENSDSDDSDRELSKRQLRKRNKIPLSQLRSSTLFPQVVEWSDADAKDPFLLITLKSLPNAIQVPAHWKSKREYLSSRKGIERQPFQLPKFIQNTGIQEMRNNEEQTLKQDQRARVQPKMGKLDIDYQKLHDAFFKHQSKPRLFGFGDVYFEGREATDEYVEEIAEIVPGRVSSKLRSALGLSSNDFNVAPPWITIMQEIGKPPAYETLIIPGLDVEYSNEGYRTSEVVNDNDKDNFIWGRLQSYEESSSDESEDEGEDEAEDEAETEAVVENEPYNTEENVKEIEISEYGSKMSTATLPEHNQDDTSQKELYTVIQETVSQKNGGLIQGDFTYNMGPDDKEGIKGKQSESQAEVESKKFRF